MKIEMLLAGIVFTIYIFTTIISGVSINKDDNLKEIAITKNETTIPESSFTEIEKTSDILSNKNFIKVFNISAFSLIGLLILIQIIRSINKNQSKKRLSDVKYTERIPRENISKFTNKIKEENKKEEKEIKEKQNNLWNTKTKEKNSNNKNNKENKSGGFRRI